MRLRPLWVLLLLPVAAAAGCTKSGEPDAACPVRIETAVYGAYDDTRTGMTGSKASFVSGDAVGLFETTGGQANVPYTYNGTAWTASAPALWRDGTSVHTFYAYYPYKTGNSGTKVPVPVLASQTIGTTPSAAADFLAAGPLSQTRSAGVGLTFTHAFALIQLNVKMGILGLVNPYTLNSITVRGGNATVSASPYGIANLSGNPPQVGYDLATGALVADANTTARFTQSFTVEVTGVSLLTTSVTLYLFVLPGTYSDPVPAISFKVALLGLVSASTYANFPNTTFKAGTKYVYDVSIGKLLRTPEPQHAIEFREAVPFDSQPINIE